jgi:N-acetylneuraminate lyase/4-hydroxy-tetrahydrodipicolinate synthase
MSYKPEGVYPAMLTPFDSEGDVNEPVLRRLTSWLIAQGVDGLFPLGSSGESIHLDLEEKVRMIEIILDEAKGSVPVTPGTSDSCAENTIRLTERARDLGCNAAVVAPPYYYRVTQEQIERHYEEVVKAVPDFPIILYNSPLFCTPIGYDVVKRLSRFENVIGMKDSSGSMVDLIHFMDKVRAAGEDINILVGREEILFPALALGAKGTMSATVGVVPEIMTTIYSSWKKGDFERARELQFSFLSLLRAMFVPPLPLGFKAALEVRGFDMGEPKQVISNAEQYNLFKVTRRIEKVMKLLLGDATVVR